MTDKKPETSPGSQAPAANVAATPGPSTTATPAPKKTAPASRSRSPLLAAFIIVLLIALALAGALWYQQQSFKRTHTDLLGQVQGSTSAANQANEQAQQALSRVQEQSRQISALETALRDSTDHLDSLEQAFQTLTDRGSDLVLINDIDHLVTIAQQQLQLSGNVANAIISLETAQAQLARANRPGLASLHQAINGDLDRLRAASTVDVALMSSQLEELSALVGVAPLMVPDDAAPEPVLEAPTVGGPPRIATTSPRSAASDADAPWWKQGFQTAEEWSRKAWEAIREDLGQFITVRRVDDPTALLMSPDQATRFRDNLRLRVMTAQLALMMRQSGVWESETQALVKALESRYDPKSPQTRQALKLARQMADTSIAIKLPTVANSLQAIESLREASAKDANGGATGSAAESPADAPAEPATSPQPAEPAADRPAASQPARDAAPGANPEAGAVPPAGSQSPVPAPAPADPAPTTPQG
jgi:uroporphyrin-3 C-methyltransferase